MFGYKQGDMVTDGCDFRHDPIDSSFVARTSRKPVEVTVLADQDMQRRRMSCRLGRVLGLWQRSASKTPDLADQIGGVPLTNATPEAPPAGLGDRFKLCRAQVAERTT
jgi:hypothetical protein